MLLRGSCATAAECNLGNVPYAFDGAPCLAAGHPSSLLSSAGWLSQVVQFEVFLCVQDRQDSVRQRSLVERTCRLFVL